MISRLRPLSKTAQLFLAILTLATFVRLYDLSGIPSSLSGDEVAFGYNAYSLLRTGRDEFGHFLPLYLQSFDDYKNPLFGYTLIPFIALFGLNEWAIRLPSVIAGILVVALMSMITHQLTQNRKAGLLMGLFASICPWLIQYSRVAIDVELALFFALLAVYFFLKSPLQKKYIWISALCLLASFYTYHSSKVWVLGMVAALLFFFPRPSHKKWFVGILIVGIIPYIYLLKTAHIGLRPYAISVFANQEETHRQSQQLLIDIKERDPFAKIAHNRRLVPINQAIGGMIKIISPHILFEQGPLNHPPYSRLLYLWQMPLIILGMVLSLHKKYFWFLFLWMLCGLIPGGLTAFSPYDRRIHLNVFPLLFFSIYPLIALRETWWRGILIFSVGMVLGISVFLYLHLYFIDGKTAVVAIWGNGMKQVVAQSEKLKSKYDDVVVSLTLNSPHIYYLYYTVFDPAIYVSNGGTISGGYLDERNRFDTYVFKFIKIEDLKPHRLFVWAANDSQPCLSKIATVHQTDGTPFAKFGVFTPSLPSCQL